MTSGEGPGWGWSPPIGLPGGRPPDAGPPAGWLPDPTGRFEERYWSGDRWTPRVRVGRAEAIDRKGVSAEAVSQTDETGPGEWYPDPTGRFEQRFFSGQAWTRHVRVGEAVALDTLGVPNTVRPPKDARPRRTGSSTSPPGWSPDPEDSTVERYWDGYQWTAARRPSGSGSSGPARVTSVIPGRVMATGILMMVILVGLLVALIMWLTGFLG
ncbi:MAG: DUF2510 domain-containing protein [Nitriliruptorales bacterium]